MGYKHIVQGRSSEELAHRLAPQVYCGDCGEVVGAFRGHFPIEDQIQDSSTVATLACLAWWKINRFKEIAMQSSRLSAQWHSGLSIHAWVIPNKSEHQTLQLGIPTGEEDEDLATYEKTQVRSQKDVNRMWNDQLEAAKLKKNNSQMKFLATRET